MIRRRLAAVAAVSALAAAACGGAEGGSADALADGAGVGSAEPSDTGVGTGPVDGGGPGGEPGDALGSGGADPNDAEPDAGAPPDERGGSDGSGGDRYIYVGWGRASPPDGAFTDVSAGQYATCGVRDSGALECWGDSFGEAPDGVFARVSLGGDLYDPHGCALSAGGSVVCWGGGRRYAKVNAPEGVFTDVAAGAGHSCGLRAGGEVVCWGEDRFGQVSAPSEIYERVFERVYAGAFHSCGLDAAGVLECWGGLDKRSVPDAPEGAFVEVSAAASGSDRRDPGVDYVCGLRVSGGIECWAAPFGAGFRFGQADPPEGEYMSLSAGGEHACAIDVDGRVVCWGNNDLRVVEPVRDRWGWTVGGDYCGYDSAYDSAFPEGPLDCLEHVGEGVFGPIGQDHPNAESPEYWGVHDGLPDPLRGPFVQVSAGVGNTCAVRFDAVLVCWSGMQGVEVLAGSFSQVALGVSHGCALRISGEVACWGISPGDERW